MYKIETMYNVGSKIWNEISALDAEQQENFIDLLEGDIIKCKKVYNDEYFYWLITFLDEKEVASFKEHKVREYQTERLIWLRNKNLHMSYRSQENELVEQLKQVIPLQFIDKLKDLVDLKSEEKADEKLLQV